MQKISRRKLRLKYRKYLFSYTFEAVLPKVQPVMAEQPALPAGRRQAHRLLSQLR